MGWIGCVRCQNFDVTSWHEILHKFGPFWTECCKATNCPKCTQIVRNTPNLEVRVQSGGSGAFVAKKSDTTSWHELLHHFGPFCIEFCKATKRSRMHPNSTIHKKHDFRVQWGGSVAFVAKNSDATSWHKLFHHYGSFWTEFCKASKRYQMHPNSIKCTKT